MTFPPPLDPLDEVLAHPPELDDGERFTRSVLDRLPGRTDRTRGVLLGAGAALATATGAALLASATGALAATLVATLAALTAGLAAAGEAPAGG